MFDSEKKKIVKNLGFYEMIVAGRGGIVFSFTLDKLRFVRFIFWKWKAVNARNPFYLSPRKYLFLSSPHGEVLLSFENSNCILRLYTITGEYVLYFFL